MILKRRGFQRKLPDQKNRRNRGAEERENEPGGNQVTGFSHIGRKSVTQHVRRHHRAVKKRETETARADQREDDEQRFIEPPVHNRGEECTQSRKKEKESEPR